MRLLEVKGIGGKKAHSLKNLRQEDQIALSYFYKEIDDALEAIRIYGPLSEFLDDWPDEDDEKDYPIGFNDAPTLPAVAKAIRI